MVDAISCFCLKTTKLFAREIDNDNEELAFVMRYVLDPNMAFYRHLGIRLPNEPPFLSFEDSPSWRTTLKPGDLLDIIKTETVPLQICGWSTGRILAIEGGKVLKISVDGEPAEEDAEKVPNDSRNIAPYGSRTGGNEWRLALKKGDIIDCLDTAATWYQSTVLDRKEDNKALIGFRVYTKDGPKKDKEGNAYNGWSSTYDEWVDIFSIRIQRPGTIAKIGGIACKKSLDEEEKTKAGIDDTSDVLVNSAVGKEVFCITRPDKVRSEVPISILNSFGKEDGFQKMLLRLNDKSKPIAYGMDRVGFTVWQ